MAFSHNSMGAIVSTMPFCMYVCKCVCVCVCVCVRPWWYVDLQDPGFELLIQHDVKAEQLVAAVRRLKVHLQQAVDVRFGADDQHRGGRSFHSRYYFTISKQIFNHPPLQLSIS